MNSKNILLVLICSFLIATSVVGQNKRSIECRTPDCEILDGKNPISDDYLKKCKSRGIIPLVTAQKQGYKTRSAILTAGNDTFYLPQLKKIPFGDSTLKKIRILNINSQNKLGDIIGKLYGSPDLEAKGIDKGDIETDYQYYAEPDYLSEIIFESLKTFGYSDDDLSIFQSDYATVYLNADIKKIMFNKTELNKSEYGRLKLHIDWSFESPYTDKQTKISTIVSSDPLAVNQSRYSYNALLRDAIEYSLIELLQTEEVRSLLNLRLKEVQGLNNTKTEIVITPNASESLGEELKTVARIKNKNDVVSSGTIISKNGYIITDFSVISDYDSTLIVQVDTNHYPATLISKAEYYNLALLKIETENLNPVSISLDDDVSLSDRVFALSYSKIKLLNAYATSGIISGIREFDEFQYYQTDLPLSNGNFGGAVLNDKLECIGVINCKINAYSVEGIGFITPIKTVLEALNIELIRQ